MFLAVDQDAQRDVLARLVHVVGAQLIRHGQGEVHRVVGSDRTISELQFVKSEHSRLPAPAPRDAESNTGLAATRHRQMHLKRSKGSRQLSQR